MRKLKSIKVNSNLKPSHNYDNIPVHLDRLAHEARNAGYELSFDENTKVLEVTAISKSDILPTINVTTVDAGNGIFELYPSLQFPALDQESFDYADSIEHVIVKEWGPVGKFITAMVQTQLDINESFDE
jgi:hypothetical protein